MSNQFILVMLGICCLALGAKAIRLIHIYIYPIPRLYPTKPKD